MFLGEFALVKATQAIASCNHPVARHGRWVMGMGDEALAVTAHDCTYCAGRLGITGPRRYFGIGEHIAAGDRPDDRIH